MLTRCIVFLVVFGGPLVMAAQSGNIAPENNAGIPTFKTATHLVAVDVVATNSKGDPVTGLKQEDFEVLEDGKPQSIASFQEHTGTAISPIELPPMPPNVYTNFPRTQSSEAINVLLLDSLNTPLADQVYVHEQMLKQLKTIPPDTRVAVFTLASRLRMLQGVTTDSTALLEAINSQKAGTKASALLPSEVEKQSNQRRVDFLIENEAGASNANQSQAQEAVEAVNAEKMFMNDTQVFLADARTGTTLQALQQLARYLLTIPGRKNVMWFSGSFPAGILPNPDLTDPFGGEKNFQEEIQKTTALLAAAQVALYPIGAEGLATDSSYQANGVEIGEKRGSAVVQDQIQNSRNESFNRDTSHAVMEQLAKETGGQAFYNANGLGAAMQHAIDNGSHYYSLTYSPSNASFDGKYRHIQVKLASGKATLSYRRGYYAEELATAQASTTRQTTDPMMQLMGRNLPDYSQVLFKLLVKPTTPQPGPKAEHIGLNKEMKGPLTRYGIDFAVAPDDLKLDAGSVRRGAIEVMLVAYDTEGNLLNAVVGRSEIQIPEKDYSTVERSGLQIHKEIDVPNNAAFLRAGIYDLKSNNVGTLGVPLAAAGTQTK